jgi:hypothetical protein
MSLRRKPIERHEPFHPRDEGVPSLARASPAHLTGPSTCLPYIRFQSLTSRVCSNPVGTLLAGCPAILRKGMEYRPSTNLTHTVRTDGHMFRIAPKGAVGIASWCHAAVKQLRRDPRQRRFEVSDSSRGMRDNGRVAPPATYTSVEDFRKAVRPLLYRIYSGLSEVNPRWVKVRAVLKKGGAWTADNAELLTNLERVYAAHRDSERVLDLMSDLWQQAAIAKRTTRETLEAQFGDPTRLFVIQPGEQLTQEILRKEMPFLDLDFAWDFHGAHTHLFQELLTARARRCRASGQVPQADCRRRWSESEAGTVLEGCLERTVR